MTVRANLAKVSGVVAAVTLAIAAGTAVGSAGSVAATSRNWQIVAVQSESANLLGVTALASDNVWAAGFAIRQYVIDGASSVTFDPLVQHWNGTAWSAVPTPSLGTDNYGQLQAIAAHSPDRIWAVGNQELPNNGNGSLIEQYNGTAWSLVPADDPSDADSSGLLGVAATGRADAWAVGYANYPDRSEPVAQHWNGTRWTRSPLPTGLGSATLTAVAARGPADVWAAGYLTGDPVSGRPSEPLLLRWNGGSWSRVALPSTTNRGLARLNAITVSGRDVWAVGSSTVGGAVNRKPLAFSIGRDGAVIEDTPDEQGQLNAVTVVNGEVWAVGYRYEDYEPLSYALRRSPDGVWERAAAPDAVGATLFGLTTVAHSSTLWTVGAMDGIQPGLPTPLAARS
jgi:hypothetical protein